MRVSLIVVFAVLSVSAIAQWTAVRLNERGSVYAVRNGIHVGAVGPTVHARMWSGRTLGMVDLNPVGYSTSYGWAVDDNLQGGHAVLAGAQRAGVWEGTAKSWVDLHPDGAESSRILALHSGWAAGRIVREGATMAYAWFGLNGEVNLHPPGAASSNATATYNGRHGGQYDGHACIFDTNPLSIVDLQPPGAVSSQVNGMFENTQVGYTMLESPIRRASMWQGTAASLVDLHPGPFHVSSRANGVWEGIQVGQYDSRAAAWYGSADAYEDLHRFLEIPYGNSEAYGVHREGDTVTVGGHAVDATIGNIYQPFIWVSKYIPPSSFTLVRGSVASGGIAEMTESDDMRLVTLPGAVLGSSDSPVQIDIEFFAPPGFHDPRSLGFTLESSVSFSQGVQRIQFYDLIRGRYATMDLRSTSTADHATLVNVFSSAEPYIENVTGRLRVRILFKPTGPSLAFPWQARIDLARLRLPGVPGK